jgi:ribosomal protein S18 acetylase RimI-like enzyme
MVAADQPDQATFVPLDRTRDRQTVLDLNVEYGSWVYEQFERHLGISLGALIGDVHAYADATIDDLFALTPPRGSFYLLRDGDATAGMGGLRPLGDGIGEIKRMYVRPNHRGRGLGRVLVERLLDDGRACGFHTVRLDTAPFMAAAQRTYQRLGFVQRERYEGVEVPSEVHDAWVFMERRL